MSAKKVVDVDLSRSDHASLLLISSPILASYDAGWKNISLVRYRLSPGETPEFNSSVIGVTMVSHNPSHKSSLISEGKTYHIPFCKGPTKYVQLVPPQCPFIGIRGAEMDATQLYLRPEFLSQIAHESVNPERVEIDPAYIHPKIDPLIWQISLSLTTVLQTAPQNSAFYADSMATALAAHLLQFYTTRQHTLREYSDGLSSAKLNQAIDYINEHLGEDLSLTKIAAQVDMSQFYFCRLFKQSVGITPHKYLLQQRVERSKSLLRQRELTIFDIAADCGFANPSHFAKCFRQHTGVSPQQFRSL
jgi:AraC family transcriptional regulator